jgi:hypothetical protein
MAANGCRHTKAFLKGPIWMERSEVFYPLLDVLKGKVAR